MHARTDPKVLEFFSTEMLPQHSETWEQQTETSDYIKQSYIKHLQEYMLPYNKIIISTK